MFKWSIEISGFQNTLRGYSQYVSDDEAQIIEDFNWSDHPHYYLTSFHFNNLANKKDVKNKSEIIINLFSGAASLAEGDILCFRLGNNIIENDLENYDIDPQLENFTQESSVNQLIKKSWADQDLKNVLDIMGEFCQQKAGNIAYHRLYFIYEILEKRWGKQKLYQIATEDFWKTFKHTSQDPKILGIEARHGNFSHKSTSNPITKENARDKVILACQRWINDEFKIATTNHTSFPRPRQDFSQVDFSKVNLAGWKD